MECVYCELRVKTSNILPVNRSALRGWECQLPFSYLGGPRSIPGQSEWDLWRKKCHCPSTSVSPVSTTPPMLHNHLHLHPARTRPTGSLKNTMLFCKSKKTGHWIKRLHLAKLQRDTAFSPANRHQPSRSAKHSHDMLLSPVNFFSNWRAVN